MAFRSAEMEIATLAGGSVARRRGNSAESGAQSEEKGLVEANRPREASDLRASARIEEGTVDRGGGGPDTNDA